MSKLSNDIETDFLGRIFRPYFNLIYRWYNKGPAGSGLEKTSTSRFSGQNRAVSLPQEFQYLQCHLF